MVLRHAHVVNRRRRHRPIDRLDPHPVPVVRSQLISGLELMRMDPSRSFTKMGAQPWCESSARRARRSSVGE